jgi:hypothetical protein
MKLRVALVAATILTVPFVARAQPVDGLYVGLGAGYNYLQDTNVKSATSPGRTRRQLPSRQHEVPPERH